MRGRRKTISYPEEIGSKCKMTTRTWNVYDTNWQFQLSCWMAISVNSCRTITIMTRNYFWTSKREKESLMDQQNRICKLLMIVRLSKWTVNLPYVYFFFSSNLWIKSNLVKEVQELQAHKLRDAIGWKWQFHGQNYSMVIHWILSFCDL